MMHSAFPFSLSHWPPSSKRIIHSKNGEDPQQIQNPALKLGRLDVISFQADYFPRALITTRSTITTRSPADETAAAVSSPEIAVAIVSPESTSMMMNSTMIPSGVRMMLMIVPPPAPLPLGMLPTSPAQREKVEHGFLFYTWDRKDGAHTHTASHSNVIE